jgi:hypothetical protein
MCGGSGALVFAAATCDSFRGDSRTSEPDLKRERDWAQLLVYCIHNPE